MTNSKLFFPFFCVLFSLALMSCPSPTSSDTIDELDINDDDDTYIEEDETLFSDQTGEIAFSINYFEFGSGQGATYWMEQEASEGNFEELSFDLNKVSGYKLGGFGVFFSQREKDTDDFNALSILLNADGEYCVGLIEDSSFTYIKEWTNHDNLNSGYNLENSINLTLSGDIYTLTINDGYACEFEDASEEQHNDGGYGYLAVVSPLENFPSITVNVLFSKQ